MNKTLKTRILPIVMIVVPAIVIYVNRFLLGIFSGGSVE